MRENPTNLNSELRLWQEKLLSRSIRRTRKLERMLELVGTTLNLQCLEISAGDGIVSSKLRAQGGSWKSLCTGKAARDSLGVFLSDSIAVLENDGKLPFENNTFDRLVIVDALKYITNDYEFLHECHRVLKNDGWVIISETRRAPTSLVALMQKLLGTAPVSSGAVRNGYKESELFDKLKDGFDVPATIAYSNCLLEAASAFGEAMQRSLLGGPCWLVKTEPGPQELKRYSQIYSLGSAFYPLHWLLSLLEFLPGHKLLIKSRRRLWRPRLSPKLVDGRSIAEAAINTKIGTAAPF